MTNSYQIYGADDAGPLILNSPHVGHNYAIWDLADVSCTSKQLRTLEDSCINLIWDLPYLAEQNNIGAMEALLPRSYVDMNRARTSLDPAQIRNYDPSLICIPDHYTALGSGVVPIKAKVEGFDIYSSEKLPTALDIIERLKWHKDYHDQLKAMLLRSVQTHGGYALLDLHACNPVGAPDLSGNTVARADIILSDCNGRSCTPELLQTVKATFERHGIQDVAINRPFLGGYITQQYGSHHAALWKKDIPGIEQQPSRVQSLQVEFNKRLYLRDDLHTPIEDNLRELRLVNQEVCKAATRYTREHLESLKPL